MDIEDLIRNAVSDPTSFFPFKFISFLRLLKAGAQVEYPIYISPHKKIKLGHNVKIKKGNTLGGDIEVGNNVIIDKNSQFFGDIKIEDYTVLNKNVELIGNIKIGKYCSIARNVLFQGINHDMDKASTNVPFLREILKREPDTISNGPIIVGDDVWIGTRAIILSGVEIGSGAIIGAGSIVTKNVKPYSITAGVPAHHVKWRFPKNIRDKLLYIRWWEWDREKIFENLEFFSKNLRNFSDIDKYIM